MITTLLIEGMSCQHCVKAVKTAIESVSGVQSVTVDLESGIAKVEHDSTSIPAMISAVEDEEYRASLVE